jgi:hypothetical protein
VVLAAPGAGSDRRTVMVSPEQVMHALGVWRHAIRSQQVPFGGAGGGRPQRRGVLLVGMPAVGLQHQVRTRRAHGQLLRGRVAGAPSLHWR